MTPVSHAHRISDTLMSRDRWSISQQQMPVVGVAAPSSQPLAL